MGEAEKGGKNSPLVPREEMSETKAATESQLAKQRARNAMEKARGREGERKRERELVKRKKDGG